MLSLRCSAGGGRRAVSLLWYQRRVMGAPSMQPALEGALNILPPPLCLTPTFLPRSLPWRSRSRFFQGMLNQTEPTKASAETDGNKEQGRTGAVPPPCTLRPSLSLVASLSRKRILHKRSASALPCSKTLHSLTPGWGSSHLLLFALLEAVLREK